MQSNYIPWKGYFDLIAAVDEFILLDDVQYTKRDWRNRNLIKTAQGAQWLTIPVANKGGQMQLIDETEISEPWAASIGRVFGIPMERRRSSAIMRRRLPRLYEAAAGMTPLERHQPAVPRGLCRMLAIGTRLIEFARLCKLGEQDGETAGALPGRRRDQLSIRALPQGTIWTSRPSRPQASP